VDVAVGGVGFLECLDLLNQRPKLLFGEKLTKSSREVVGDVWEFDPVAF
jgi:hypothetical protein